MSSSTDRFAPFAARMRAEGLPEIAVKTFEHYYGELVRGRDRHDPRGQHRADRDAAGRRRRSGPTLAERGRARAREDRAR